MASVVRRSWLVMLGLCAAVALVATPAASAKTIRLNWREAFPLNSGKIVFVVKRIDYGRFGWKVHARVVNRSRFPMRWQRNAPELNPPCGGGFFIFYFGATHSALFADVVKPRFPAVLEGGRAWDATFGSRDHVVRGKKYRVHFGCFILPSESGYPELDWTTDHFVRPR
jgi:hypothetical protein